VSVEAPTVALARIVQPLDERRATALRESFGSMFDRVEAWQSEAAGLTVTAEDQTGKMKRARLLRLEIKEARVALDKKRKELKSGIVVEGRAIDGAFAVFEGLASPLEKHLLDQEQFAERAEAARRDVLRAARQAALMALGVTDELALSGLGAVSEEAWAVMLADAEEDKRERDEAARVLVEQEAARRAEEAKADVERRAREEAQKKENEKLRREAATREAKIAAERREREAAARKVQDEADRKAKKVKDEADRKVREAKEAAERKVRAEADARKKAEEETRALREAEEDRLAREAETSKPTKAKYAALVEALQAIAAARGEPKAAKVAKAALQAAGL